jgi:AcrR family transcriptional regulator
MNFHLQLFPAKFSDWVIVLLVLFLPAALTAYALHNLVWLAVVPFGIIVLALCIAALPIKRKVTREQFADELERHLTGTEGPWDWDDTTSVAIADPLIEEVRSRLGPNLDSLAHESDKDELRAIIAALRRGEQP